MSGLSSGAGQSRCCRRPARSPSRFGTRLREVLTNPEPVPPEFSRPEILAVLQGYYDELDK